MPAAMWYTYTQHCRLWPASVSVPTRNVVKTLIKQNIQNSMFIGNTLLVYYLINFLLAVEG
jgi:hypothetical protein